MRQFYHADAVEAPLRELETSCRIKYISRDGGEARMLAGVPD